jgi:hypothetical protein
VVRVDGSRPSWSAGTPVQILNEAYFANAQGRTYDVSPDDQRFLMIRLASSDRTATPPQIVVVKNWTEELKRLVPPR